jgi:hypothetical protein
VLVVLSGIALATSAIVGRWGARWPRALFHPAVAAATVLIVSAVVFAPNPVTSLGAATLIFVVVDAYFFFSARQAVAHLGCAVVGITAALAAGDVGLSTTLGLDLVLVSIGTVIRRLVILAASASRDPLTGLSNRRGFDDRALYDAKILGRGRAELVSESARPHGAQVLPQP